MKSVFEFRIGAGAPLAAALALAASGAFADTHYTAVIPDGPGGLAPGISSLGANGIATGSVATAGADDTVRSVSFKDQAYKTFVPLGRKQSFAQGVSSAGDVCGEMFKPGSSLQESYLRHADGTTEQVQVTERGYVRNTDAIAVNASGTVVGHYMNDVFQYIAFSWKDGVATPLPTTLGGAQSQITAINDSGLMVGAAEVSPENYRAVAWTAEGRLFELGALSADGRANATGVSADGTIVGIANAHVAFHAFSWNSGVMTDLGTLPGAVWSQAFAINAAGNIVGSSGDAAGNAHAVLWRDGRPHDLNAMTTLPAGVTMSNAFGIADNGTIVAHGTTSNGSQSVSLVLTPDSN